MVQSKMHNSELDEDHNHLARTAKKIQSVDSIFAHHSVLLNPNTMHFNKVLSGHVNTDFSPT